MKQQEQSMVDWTELERLQENALATNGTVNEGPEWAAFTNALGIVFPAILSERREMLNKLEAAQTEREQLNEQLRKMGADWLATAINGMAESLPAARIRALVEQHGSYRKVGELLGVDHAYLHRIVSGEKDNMSDELLRKIGLRRGTFYATLDKETA